MKNINKNIARKNFSLWNKLLASKNEKAVAKLYDKNVSFLPTLSSEFKTKKEQIEKYFKHFLEKEPQAQIIKEKIQIISNDHYLHSGFYNFFLLKTKETIKARFTFIWKKNKRGEWKIIHHHSSLLPK